MIAKIIKYSAVSAKIQCMYRKILKQHDYSQILKLHSVRDIIMYLKSNTHFSGVLSHVDDKSNIHRGKMELVLRSSILKDYNKIISFSKGIQCRFLKVLYLRYEIESLKMLIRILETEKNTNLTRENLSFLSTYKFLDLDKISSSLNTNDFIRNLEGTVYYDILKPYLNKDTDYTLFHLEMELDMFYYTHVQKHKKELFSGDDYKIIHELFGNEIDILNLLTIYRCKKFFNIDKDLIFSYLIPSFYKISKKTIQELINSTSFEEYFEKVSKSEYAYIFSNKNNGFYEINALNYLYALNMSFFRKNRFSIAAILTYFKLKEYELQSITSVLEGIRYNLGEDALQDYIIGSKYKKAVNGEQ